MKTEFILIAMLMILIALALVVVPMLSRGRRDGRQRHVLVLSLCISFLLPPVVLGMYWYTGTPAALSAAALQPRMSLNQAITQLRAQLTKHPDDLQGWLLLGRTYANTNRLQDARQAYRQALKLAPDNTGVMLAWVEADIAARASHRITDHARALLQQATSIDPNNQRALWLLGISDYQRNQFTDTAQVLRQLKALLQPGSKVARTVDQQIVIAEARAAGKTQQQAMALLQSAPSASVTNNAHAAPIEGAHLAVRVRLAPALRKRVPSGATLYVFAKAPGGAPMPLAVARLKASTLPTTVMLTDGMGVEPTMRLSSVNKVILTARISHNGQPIAAAGDLEGTTGPVPVDAGKAIDLLINQVH